MSELTEPQLRALTPDERAILSWLAFYCDQGVVRAFRAEHMPFSEDAQEAAGSLFPGDGEL